MFSHITVDIVAVALAFLLPATQSLPVAQSPSLPSGSIQFKHINLEQGLSNSRVLSILQDRQGFMWFGTGEGLDRYDGYDFTLYQTDPNDPRTLSNNVVWVLYEDRAGAIWVGTEGGLNRYDPATETFTRYRHDPADPQSLSDDTVLSLYEDQAGGLLVGTLGGGLNRFDRESETFTRYQHDPNDAQSLGGNEVRSIVEDGNGQLWVGTYGGGLNQLVPGEQAGEPPTFRRFQHDATNPQSLSGNLVHGLYSDRTGILWVATWGGGLNRFDPTTETFTHYRADLDDDASLSSDITTVLAGGPGGELWVGTWAAGLNRFDPTPQTWTRYQHDPAEPLSLSHDTVRSLYISREGLVYAGTAGGGLNVFNLRPNPFHTLRNQPGNPNSLSQNDVRAVLEDRTGLYWIGTNSAGLNRYDPLMGQFTQYLHDPDDPTSLANNTVRALAEDQAGNVWVGTFGGLDKLDPQTGQFVHYQADPANPHTLSANRIQAIYQDRAGTLWIGSYIGLNQFDPETQTFTRYLADVTDATSLSSNIVTSIYEDGAGTLWVGTQGGLNRMEQRTGTFTRYLYDPNSRSSLSNSAITVIYGDPSGFLWLGTYGGFNRFDPRSGQALRYTTQDGLSSNVVWGILPDEQGHLWLSTNNGLDRFDLQTNTFRRFGVADGLVSPVFNAAHHKGSSGTLLMGTVEGLLFFSPTAVREETHRVPLVFTDFQLVNRPVPIGGDSVLQQPINKTRSLTLPHLERVISFSFAALDFWSPQRVRYRYVLRGFDTKWTEVDYKRRFVTYTNLAPGSYIFLVQYTDQNGAWVLPGRAITLDIVPPWWQSFWFRFLLVALLGLGGMAAFRFRILMLQQRNQELEQQVNTKTETLQLMNHDLEQSITELATLNLIAHILNRMAPIEAIRERLVVILTRLFDAVGVVFYLLSDDQQVLDIIDYHRVANPATIDPLADANAFQLSVAQVAIPPEFPLQSLFHQGKAAIFKGTPPNSALPPFSPYLHQLEAAHLMLVPIHVRGELVGALAVAHTQAEQGFTAEDVTLAETIANQLAGALENLRLFNQEHRQREVAERRSRELATLLNISQEVASTLDLEPLLTLIIQRLEQVIDFSTFLLLESGGEELFILAQRGVLSAFTPVDEFPTEWLQAETELFTTRRPLRSDDLAQDEQLYIGLRKTFGHKAHALLQQTRSCLLVPMVARDRNVGLLWFGHEQPNHYSASQANYMTAIAHQAAIAIENAHLHQEMQTAAADSERNRLAQELHDSVSQTLLAANMLARSLSGLWEQEPEQGKQALGQLQRMMGNALAEMRTLMLELRPAIMSQQPLGEILRHLSDSFASRAQLPVQLNVNGDTTLPAICQIAFYRIAQGALNNIQQHAQASQVTMDLTCTPRYVELRVADNGKGFDLAAVPPDRMGLTIMRERAAKIGATFQLDNQPGQGTQITVRYDYPIG